MQRARRFTILFFKSLKFVLKVEFFEYCIFMHCNMCEKLMADVKKYSRQDLMRIIAQQPPFMFLDGAEISEEAARGFYTIRGDEDFLKGHFPNNPVFPASIMLEALGQLAVAYLLEYDFLKDGNRPDKDRLFFTSADGVRCQRICRPGDRLDFEVKAKRVRFPLGMFEGRVTVGGESAAFVEKISLTFDIVR